MNTELKVPDAGVGPSSARRQPAAARSESVESTDREIRKTIKSSDLIQNVRPERRQPERFQLGGSAQN